MENDLHIDAEEASGEIDTDAVIDWFSRARERDPGPAADALGRAVSALLNNDTDEAVRILACGPDAALGRRDTALRQLADEFELSAAEISRRMRRYFTSSWRHDRHQHRVPDRLLGRPESLLWKALKIRPTALCARQIQRIINRTS